MAFYTSRVDNNGNEIERHNMQMPATTRTRKLDNFGDNDSLNFDFDDFQGTSMFDDLTPMDDRKSINDQEGGIVPPLDLHSELNFPTQSKYTFRPRKYDTAKIVMEPNKEYEEWLEKKRQRQAKEAAKRKREEEEKHQKEEERKRLAEENFQKWLDKKNAAENKHITAYKRKSESGISTQRSTISLNNTGEEKRKKLEEWENKKREQEKAKRLREQRAKEKHAKEEETRKQLNKGAHEKWLERNKNAPKPVPLNQGLLTLRGTTSKIFVNPNEWRTD